jgi:hypothetical protein
MALSNPEDFLIRPLDRIRIKGKQQSVLIYEVLDGETEEIIGQKSALDSWPSENDSGVETGSQTDPRVGNPL